MRTAVSVALAALLVVGILSFAPTVAHSPQPHGQFVVDDYTLALWHLDEGEGQVIHDESIHHNDGILGSTSNVEDSDPSWVKGFTGELGDYALSFDRYFDYANVPDNPDGSLDLQLFSQFTIEFWTYSRQISRAGRGTGQHWNSFLHKAFAPSNPQYVWNGYFVGQSSYPQPTPFISMSACYGSEATVFSSLAVSCIPPPLNEWVLITVVYDGNYARIYFNNVLQVEKNQVSPNPSIGREFVDNIAPFIMGDWPDTDWPWMDPIDGVIDEVRLSNIARIGRSQLVDWWPMYRHDTSHTGYSTSTAPDTNNTIWSYKIGNYVESSPAIADGKVYIGSDDHNFYCLNATTGAYIWIYPTPYAIGSCPAIADGKVCMVVANCVYCLNATTGAFIWIYPTNNGIASSPAIADGKVYIGSTDDNVYCLNATTGESIWNYTTGSMVWSSPAVAEGKVYFGSHDYNFYCLNATTGAYIWSHKTNGWIASSAAIADGKVYIGSADQVIYCLDAATGAYLWSYPTSGGIESSPAIADGKVYIGSDDHNFYCLNATTGAYIWSYPSTGPFQSSPAIADGKVYIIGFFDSSLYCLNATTGAYIWSYTNGSYPQGKWIWISPAVAEGKVYMGSPFDGSVYAFGPTVHDIAITDIACYRTIVGQGSSTRIKVAVENQGDYNETFNVTVQANTTSIASQTVTLSSKNSTTLTFTWNTTEFAKGNYTIGAVADTVLGETDTADNTYIDGAVIVVMLGDLNADGKVDILDVFLVARAFGSKPGNTRWDSNADVNEDGIVDILDIFAVAREFGKIDP